MLNLSTINPKYDFQARFGISVHCAEQEKSIDSYKSSQKTGLSQFQNQKIFNTKQHS